MEGKVVIMTILSVSLLVLGQTQGQEVAFTSCCPNATASSYFNRCRLAPLACAAESGCILLYQVQECPTGWEHDILQNTVHEYCKSGCVSSVCGAKFQNSVEKCTNACSAFCSKGSIPAVETA